MGVYACHFHKKIFFIDGTVEGTNIHVVDDRVGHDYTYYGNGCPGEAADGGSTKACSTRIIATHDGENLNGGTYYNFHAVSSGNAVTTATENANTPDTFCPLGWQLPYSGTGGDYYDKSRSWRYLLTRYSIVGESPSDSNTIRSYPFSYISAGMYNNSLGVFYLQGGMGFYWSQTAKNYGYGYRLNTHPDYVRSSVENIKAGSASVRCV